MFRLKLLCFLACAATSLAMLTKDEQEVLNDMDLIVKYYLRRSQMPRQEQDLEEVYHDAEEFYKYAKAKGRSIGELLGNESGNFTGYSRSGTAWNGNNTELEKDVPMWDLRIDQLDYSGYDYTRFDRYLTWNEIPSTKRRLTWLYPIDGCFMRAELYSKKIVAELKTRYPHLKFDLPKKHFIFGNLKAKSDSTVNGYVRWSWHVAPIVRLRDGKLYVLDPSLSANPIEKESWHELMNESPGKVTGYVTCESNTYVFGDECFNPAKIDRDVLEIDVQGYLRREWNYQYILGRDPAFALSSGSTKYYLQG